MKTDFITQMSIETIYTPDVIKQFMEDFPDFSEDQIKNLLIQCMETGGLVHPLQLKHVPKLEESVKKLSLSLQDVCNSLGKFKNLS